MIRCISFLFLLLIMGCNSTTTITTIVSIADAEFKGTQFSKILVNAPYEDLEIKDNLERVFTGVLRKKKVVGYRALKTIPPLKEYTSEEISKIMIENGIEALLVVGVTDFWVNYNQVTPDQTKTKVNISSKSNTDSHISSWSYLLNVDSKTTNTTSGEITTTVKKGIVLSKSNYKIDARLFILKLDHSPQMVWRSSSTTSGNYFSSNSKVLLEAASNIANQLYVDGFLPISNSKLTKDSKFSNEIVILGGENYDIILGCLSCDNQDSPFLNYGSYGIGNKNSLWNVNIFTSDTSNFSVCNPLATHPPIIYDSKSMEDLGYISNNPSFKARYKELQIRKWLEDDICK